MFFTGFCSTYLRQISQEVANISIRKMSLKNTLSEVLAHLLVANELTTSGKMHLCRKKEIKKLVAFHSPFPKYSQYGSHGPLTRYVKLRVTHVPGMPGAFSPPPTSKETAS